MTWRAATAVLSAFALVVAELFVVSALQRALLTTGWELFMGALLVAPFAWLLVVPPALFGAGLLASVDSQRPLARSGFAGLIAVWGGVVAAFVATGRHFAAPSQRVGVALLLAACLGVAAFAAHPTAARLRRESPRLLAALSVLKLLLLELINASVLVRLYPAFHTGLAWMTVALAPFVVSPWLAAPATGPRRHLRVAVATVLTALSLAFLIPSARRLARFDNFRLLVSEGAPILRHAVLLAARVAPPPPLDETDPCLLSPGSCTRKEGQRAGPSFVGRDLVLVTIDALRADYVSAYGYDRLTTPHIDALAREGVLFESAYCATPHTSYSVASLMTGKYQRPLVLQGKGADSETLASALRTYGYRTAAFYPPAVFFIDQARFAELEAKHFGFEYAKVEFLEGEGRVRQVTSYLDGLDRDQRLFLWVHLFGPHEPYEAHPEHRFGDRNVDRYDSEIGDSDSTLGAIVDRVRASRPNAVVIVTADHGEEFGEHGGRYHGTSVYEEQVHVPLVVSAPGLVPHHRVGEVVQSVDILPTVLGALAVPPSPRVRGRDLGALLTGKGAEGPGFASAETDDWALLAEGPRRLVCERRLGACRLYDIARDPEERVDTALTDPEAFARMRTALQGLAASHGTFESRGLRAESGRGWPSPILRGIAGDADAVPELAELLDDADRDIRRKAAELLFELRRELAIPALRLSVSREEDPVVKRYSALALTRLGETVPLASDLLNDPELQVRRLAALAFAERGDRRGEALLIEYWRQRDPNDHARAVELLRAFAKLGTKEAVPFLLKALGDVRLRPEIAKALSAIGDDSARGALVSALAGERSETVRIALTEALVALGAREELARPLIRFLGTPDPMPGGLAYAQKAGVLDLIGGPDAKGLKALQTRAGDGVTVQMVVPKGGNGTGVRVLVRAWAGASGGSVRVGQRANKLIYNSKREALNTRELPVISDSNFATLEIRPGASPADAVEVFGRAPAALGGPGRQVEIVVVAGRDVHVEAMALVPFADEIPAPPPEPWSPPR